MKAEKEEVPVLRDGVWKGQKKLKPYQTHPKFDEKGEAKSYF